MTSLVKNLAIVALAVAAAWFVLGLVGVHFALWTSLALSLVLTAVLTLAMSAFRGRRRV
ncbi:MAG: hypothetical protein VYE22_31690 [Myxococcota bacterium]|nr:hypothetical protein [Myxococcota bacterium]